MDGKILTPLQFVEAVSVFQKYEAPAAAHCITYQLLNELIDSARQTLDARLGLVSVLEDEARD